MGQHCVDDYLNVQHTNFAVLVDIGLGYDLGLRLRTEVYIHAKLNIKHIYPTILVYIGRLGGSFRFTYEHFHRTLCLSLRSSDSAP